MALSQEFLMELKYRNDIESVLSPYIALKRRGSNLVGLCPFHNEKTPSFTVYPENGSYYCFGCGQGGDIITALLYRLQERSNERAIRCNQRFFRHEYRLRETANAVDFLQIAYDRIVF